MEWWEAAGVAAVAAWLGYLFRWSEHRRDKRYAAYTKLFAAFYEAVVSGARLLSIHTVLGSPSAERSTDEQSAPRWEARRAYWTEAREGRHAFELAAFEVGLVGTRAAARGVDEQRQFLRSELYSGEPWRRGYPEGGNNPSDIERLGLDLVVRQMKDLRRQLWRTRRS